MRVWRVAMRLNELIERLGVPRIPRPMLFVNRRGIARGAEMQGIEAIAVEDAILRFQRPSHDRNNPALLDSSLVPRTFPRLLWALAS